jgi:hypothetical protein
MGDIMQIETFDEILSEPLHDEPCSESQAEHANAFCVDAEEAPGWRRA